MTNEELDSIIDDYEDEEETPMTAELAIECIETQKQFTNDLTNKAFDMAISALKSDWIPIEEREPDNVHERVYVTQLVPKSPCKPNGTTVYITRFIDLHEKKKYITAWQPLPEPYKRESEDEK